MSSNINSLTALNLVLMQLNTDLSMLSLNPWILTSLTSSSRKLSRVNSIDCRIWISMALLFELESLPLEQLKISCVTSSQNGFWTNLYTSSLNDFFVGKGILISFLAWFSICSWLGFICRSTKQWLVLNVCDRSSK